MTTAELNAAIGPQFWLGLATQWVPSMLAAVAAAVVFYLLARAVRRVLVAFFHRTEFDPTLAAFVETATQTTIAAVGLLVALDQLGVDTTSVLASLGVVGLTLGFAAQDTLSNVISGLFIFWDRPFVIGDLVEIDGEYGRVETITLRSTRLVTPDGKMIALPNTLVAKGKVASYTNFPKLRLDIDVTVGVEENIARVRGLLLDLVRDDPSFSDDPAPPVVIVTALNDYNVALQLRVWLIAESTHIGQRARLREAIFDTLTAAKVDMPFETLRLAPVQVTTSKP